MNKDCNGCFGAAGDDCQRCQGVDEVTPPKLDITSELIISAHNTQMDYCETIKAFGDCNKCIFTQLSHLGIIHYQDRPCTLKRITLPSLDGNTVTYIKDGQLKRVTCGRHEEAVEFYEEVRHGKKWSEMTEQEVNRLKQQQCMKCEYYSRLAGDGVNHATCEYITRVGHSRGCSPLECKQKGIFEPRRTQRRRKS